MNILFKNKGLCLFFINTGLGAKVLEMPFKAFFLMIENLWIWILL